jgi:hypothetical protein
MFQMLPDDEPTVGRATADGGGGGGEETVS